MDHLDESFGTLSQTINALVKLGYTHDFNVQDDSIVSSKSNKRLSPEDFHIDKVYRFEGASDPDNQSILYAISSENHDLKGILVNAYGVYSDDKTSKLIERLEIKN